MLCFLLALTFFPPPQCTSDLISFPGNEIEIYSKATFAIGTHSTKQFTSLNLLHPGVEAVRALFELDDGIFCSWLTALGMGTVWPNRNINYSHTGHKFISSRLPVNVPVCVFEQAHFFALSMAVPLEIWSCENGKMVKPAPRIGWAIYVHTYIHTGGRLARWNGRKLGQSWGHLRRWSIHNKNKTHETERQFIDNGAPIAGRKNCKCKAIILIFIKARTRVKRIADAFRLHNACCSCTPTDHLHISLWAWKREVSWTAVQFILARITCESSAIVSENLSFD